MKKLVYLLIISLLVVGCKATEEGYRAAYDRTMSARADADSTMAADGFRREVHMRGVRTSSGDTVQVSTQYVVAQLPDGKTSSEGFQRYLVVVGRFSQQFNALSMSKRLQQAGYPDAVVVKNSKSEFFVAIDNFNTLAEATALRQKLTAMPKPPVVMKAPMPFILESAAHRR